MCDYVQNNIVLDLCAIHSSKHFVWISFTYVSRQYQKSKYSNNNFFPFVLSLTIIWPQMIPRERYWNTPKFLFLDLNHLHLSIRSYQVILKLTIYVKVNSLVCKWFWISIKVSRISYHKVELKDSLPIKFSCKIPIWST